MPIRTGIFSGSFNPIHIGHLALANYLCEYEGLDEVWFMATPHNPLKQSQELWDDDFRLQLVKKAIESYPRFQASDFEFHLPRPNYTFNTLQALQSCYPDRQFILIIGSDNWHLFPHWYKHEEIVQSHELIIYPRPQYPVDESSLPANVHLAHSPLLEVSSTFIRQAIRQKKEIRFFLPHGVYEFICQHLHTAENTQ